MGKLKTNGACKKRLEITGTGRVKFKNCNKRHNMFKKNQRQNRNNRKPDYLRDGQVALLFKNLIMNGLCGVKIHKAKIRIELAAKKGVQND